MNCPHCQTNSKLHVKETRLQDGDIVRRRACENCGKHFGTREKHDPKLTMGQRQGFVRKTPTAPAKANNNDIFKVWK